MMTAKEHFDRGKKALDEANWVEAIEEFNKAIKLDPNYTVAYNNRGIALGNLGQHEEAIADFDQAIELDLNYAAAYNNRGIAKKDLGRYEEAIVDCAKAIALDPNNAAAYNNRGNALGNLGRHKEAIANCDRAIALDPNNAMAYYNRGRIKRKSGRESEALEDFKKANEIDPTVISKEQVAALQRDAQKDKQKTEEVEGFQKIFEDLRKDHDDSRNWWFWASVWMAGFTFLMLIALPIIDDCWGLSLCGGVSLASGEYNFYAIYAFLVLTTGFVARQYTNAKRLMQAETNRLAMAKLFEKIHNSDIDKNKEYHLFIPGLIQSITSSTREGGNAEKGGSTAIGEELTSILKPK